MKKLLSKIAAALAATTLLTGMAVTPASAYTYSRSWNVFLVSTPYAPNQHRSYSTTMPTYGDGYISKCSSISGSYDRYVTISAPGIYWRFTTKGTSDAKQGTASGSKITFNCYGYGSEIVANGEIGYNM